MKLMYLMTEPFGVGGVQSDMLALSEHLTKKGHEIFVATTPGVLLEELLSTHAHFVNLDFHIKGPKALLHSALRLRKVIVEEEIEVLAPQSVRTTLVSFVGLRVLPCNYRVTKTGQRLPIITTIHNIHNPRYCKYGGYLLNACSDYVIFESHYERNRLLANGLSTNKSTVIHSGIDTERFQRGDPAPALLTQYGLDKQQHTIFGIVARLSEEKGHHYLLHAFATLYREDKSLRLMIVGDGPLRPQTQALATTLGIVEGVIFTGLQRNVPAYLALFDVFVLASTRESFPLAAREAMAAGKAVIAPNIGGCPEVVDDGTTGYLFEAGNTHDLAAKMRQIIGNKRFVECGRQAAGRAARLFSEQQWIEGDEAVYLKWHLPCRG
jgi:glycosyltransferase involved in cell wall biosynthesis